MLGAYEWGLADKTKKANAALAGLGATRRILVSDTMLADYSDDEIEIVLAHELAHHVHGDIWKGIAFESALVVGGFFLAARLLDASIGRARAGGRRRSRRAAAAAARGRRGVGRDAARGVRLVPGLRAQRRSVRARAHPESRRVRVGDAPAGGAEPRRGASLAPDPVAVLQPSSGRGADRRRAGVQAADVMP